MRKLVLAVVGVALVHALAGTDAVEARVSVHITVPPPPAIVFEHEPEVVVVPRTRVYYVPNQDYDLFRYRGVWYVNRGGYWYTARSYRGPFVSIAYARVPRAIVVTPGEYHHHPIHPPHAPAHFRHRGHWVRPHRHR